mgnify:CR=1 FL=1
MTELERLKLELKNEIQKDESRLYYKKELLQTLEEKGVCIYTDFEEEKYKGDDKFIIELDIFEDAYFIRQTKNLTLKEFDFNLECSNLDTAVFFYKLLNKSL